MKICLYLEFEDLIKVSGIKSAFNIYKKALDHENIEYVTSLDYDSDILHIHFPGPKSLIYINRFKQKNKKVVICSYITYEDFRNTFLFSNVYSYFLKYYLRYFYNQADLILAPTQYTKNLLLDLGIKKEIKVLLNGVDTTEFKFSNKKRNNYRKKYNLKEKTIYSVGLVLPRKGIFDFIKMANKIPVSFVWFGDFIEKYYYKLKYNPYVKFTGFVDDISSAHCSGDIFVFPSYEENQGLVILEAAACGRPLIVRDIPVYEGWLENKKNCLKAKNNEEFIECINSLLSNKNIANKLSKGALKLAKENDLNIMGKKLKNIYLDLIKK